MAGVERKIKIKRYTGTGTDWDTILPVTKADIVTIDPSITIHGVSQSNVQSAIVQLNTYKVDTGATLLKVNNNNVTPSDSPTKEIYAPTTGGTSGNYLESSGSTSAPTWKSKVTDIANITSANENNLPTSKTVKDYIDEKVTGVYVPKGAVAFDEISPMPPTASGLGWVYEITNDFTIASGNTNWVASARGKSFQAGTNVVCIDIGTSSSHDYKWDVLSGILNYKTLTVNNTADGQRTYNGSQDVTVNIPTSLKNPYSVTFTGKEPSGGTSQELSYDGSVAKTVQVGENDGSDYAIYPTVNGNTIKLNLGYHASSSTKYGIGTSSLYGHNKLKTGEILNRNIHITGTDSATATETDGISASGAHTHFDLNTHLQTVSDSFLEKRIRDYNLSLLTVSSVDTSSVAKFYEKLGYTIPVCQLVKTTNLEPTKTVNDVVFTKNNNGTFSIAGTASATIATVLAGTFSVIGGHYYYVGKGKNISVYDGYMAHGMNGVIYVTATGNIDLYAYIDNGKVVNETIPVICFDITSWGSDIITDLTSHPEHFSWYYNGSLAYDAGSLKNASGRYLVCTHRQLWDEQTRKGYYNSQTGAYVSNNDYLCSVTKQHIIPNRQYHCKLPRTNNTCDTTIMFYDNNENYLGYHTARGQNSATQTFTAPANAVWFNLYITDLYGTTYQHDITISLYYSAEQGGEGYDQYYSYVAPKVIDTGSEELLAFDKKLPSGVIDRNTLDVDFATLTWTNYATNKFRASLPTAKNPQYGEAFVNINDVGMTSVDQTVELDPSKKQMALISNVLYVANSAWNTTSDITGHMQLELATPTTEQGTSFAENIEIDDYGMMYWLDTDGNLVDIPQGVKLMFATSLKDAVIINRDGVLKTQEDIYKLQQYDVTILNNGSSVAKQTTEENGNLIINTVNGIKSSYDSTNHRVKVESDLKSLSLSGYSSAQGQEVGIEYKGITNNSSVTFGDGLDTSKSGQNLTVVLKSHAWSSGNGYGKGTTTNFGHVKLVTGDMNGATNTDGEAVSKNHTHSQYSLTTHNHSGVYLENVNYSSDSSSVTDSPVISVVKSGNNVQAKKSNSISLNDVTILANQGAKISFNRSSGGNAWNIGINSSDLNTGELSLYQGTDSPTPFIRVSDGSSGKIELKKNTEVNGLISEIIKSGSTTLTTLQDKYVYKIPIGTSAPTDRDYKTGDLWFEALKYISATVSNLGSSNPSSVTFNNTGFTKDNLGITEVTLSDNNVYIKIPTMYRKVNTVVDNQITSFTISNVQLDGSYEPYPCFLDESGYILPYICIGKQWYGASQTPANGRTACRNLGTGFQMYDWMIQKLWQDLMIMLNSSVNIGNTSTGAVGINSSTYLDTLGIFWGANSSGNTGFWVDGIIKDTTGYFYACDKPSYYASLSGTGVSASTLSNYNKVNYTLPHHTATTWYEISKLGYDENYPFVNFPSGDTSNSSYNTYYCDGLYSASGSRPVDSNAGAAAADVGAFYCRCIFGWSDSRAVRSCYRPL